MLKYTTNIAAGVVLAMLALPVSAQETAAEAPAADVAADTVVATVNGSEITLGQMIIARNQLPPQYQQLPDEALFTGVLDQLIQQQVLAETMESDPLRVTVALENQRRSLLAGEVINTLVEASVTDEAIAAAYEEQFASAEPVIEWNASHVLVATEEEALAARARVEAGEDFADVARELSTDPGSGTNGGNLGWFGPGMMVPPFEEAVATLEVGALSQPVETQFGFHILILNEVRDRAAPALDEIAGELAQQIQQAAIETRLQELLDAAEVTRPEEGAFDPTILRNLDLLRD